VNGRVAWTQDEEFSHIIHASNLSVSGTDALVVANSTALGEALLTADSRAAYEVWLSTESWAVENDGFYNPGGSIYLESPGGAKVVEGTILNEGLIRFRCPWATDSSTAFEPSRTLKVFGGAAILSGTQEGSGVIPGFPHISPVISSLFQPRKLRAAEVQPVGYGDQCR